MKKLLELGNRIIRNKKNKKQLESEVKLHFVFGFLYLIQIILLVIFSKGSWLSITTNYLAYDTLLSNGEQIVHSAGTSRLFDFNMLWLLVIILAISLVGHFLLATKFKKMLSSKSEVISWLFFGVVNSLLTLIIALLSGVFDFSSLVLLFGVCIMASIGGIFTQLYLQKDKKLANYGLIYILKLTLLPWAVILIYILGTFVFGGNSINAWVYLVYLTLMLTQIAFGYVYGQIKKQVGKWRDEQYSQKVVYALFFICQTLVVWQVFFGSLI